MHRVILVCVLAAVSCVREREAPRPVAPAPQQPAAVTAPAPAALPDRVSPAAAVAHELAGLLDGGELIVGTRTGLEAWQPDGSGHRMITTGAALHPRRFGRDHVLALRPLADADLRDGAVLELISLSEGARRELAQLPAFRCAGQPTKPATLSVTAPASFEVHSEKRVACLDIADGALNTATVRVRARVDLAAAQVSRWLVFGEAECAAPEGVVVGEPPSDRVCWRMAEVAREPPNPAAYPFTFDNEHVRSSAVPAAKSGTRKLQARGYEIASVSPSNRWLLLAGDYTERETTYRRLLLLDRSQGALFPVSDRAGPWPPPLSAAGARLAVPVKQASLVANASDVRWLGGGEETEVLLLDNLVIKPGRPAFQIADAEIAR